MVYITEYCNTSTCNSFLAYLDPKKNIGEGEPRNRPILAKELIRLQSGLLKVFLEALAERVNLLDENLYPEVCSAPSMTEMNHVTYYSS